MKILDFKSISPFFDQERDGVKPFTIRLVDNKDKRFRALAQWRGFYHRGKWAIRITNPATGETFCRLIREVGFITHFPPLEGTQVPSAPEWRIIFFEVEVKGE